MITGDSWNGVPFEKYRATVILPKLAKHHLPAISQTHKSAPLTAHVNAGRWIVKCECGGAELAWENGLFMCQSCFNAGHQGKYRQVVFPAERKEVEYYLHKRPLPNRNWTPTETVDTLKHENAEHASELLEVG